MTTSIRLKFQNKAATSGQQFVADVQTFVELPDKEPDLQNYLSIKDDNAKDRGNASFFIFSELPVIEDSFLKSLLQYIIMHIDETNLNVNKISKAMQLSRSQLHRKVKALTNLSVTQFVNVIKINVTKNRLLTTNLTISEIAYDTGFQSLAYFSKVFSKIAHCCPTQYRKQGKKLLMQQ